MAAYRFMVLLFLTAAVLFRAVTANDDCKSEGAGSGGGVPLNTTNTRCIPVSYAKENSFIFDTCINYIPAEKQFIYDYGLDYAELIGDLSLLDATLRTSVSSRFCRDLLRGYTCNYVYPGCNNETGLPQGICREECERYVLSNVCKSQFDSLAKVTAVDRMLTFTRQCNNTLLLLKEFGINSENFDHCDCINITGTLSEEPPAVSSLGPLSTTHIIMTTSEPGSSNLNLLLIIVIAVGGLVMLSCISMAMIVLCSWRARRARNKLQHLLESSSGQILPNNYQLQLIENNHHDYDDIAPDLFQLSEEDVHAFGRNAKLREVLLPFDNLQITGELGEGAFGRVFKGFLQTEETETDGEQRKSLEVAIKTIKNTQGMYRELKDFIEESVLMCSFHHPHVLGMVGICLDTVQSPYLLLPFMANGDLRTFLRNKRDTSKASETGYPEGLDYNLLVRMCYEIALGMEYLASKKLVHRDLAARNCMVDKDLTVKVADFGLARVIYHTDYYRQHQQTKVPVKWMAPESLHDMISTEKSDVWSYGVVCWEVFSLGRLPYPTLANHEVVDYLERGSRLKKPALCTDIIYDLVQRCWDEDMEKRPSFTEIVSQYHEEELVPESCRVKGDSGEYVLLGPETEKDEHKKHHEEERKGNSMANDDSDSLLNAILAHFQTTLPASFVFDTILNSRSGRDSYPVVSKPDLEYYIDMSSHSLGASVFVNQTMHEYDNISIEDVQERRAKSVDDLLTPPDDDFITKNNAKACLPKSNSDYILMQSAESTKP